MELCRKPTFLITIAVIFVLGFWSIVPALQAAVGQLYPGHADARHGTGANLARQCSDRPELKLYNPVEKRTAYLCTLETGEIGAHFLDENNMEVTAYPLNKVTQLAKAVEHLAKTGFFPIQ